MLKCYKSLKISEKNFHFLAKAEHRGPVYKKRIFSAKLSKSKNEKALKPTQHTKNQCFTQFYDREPVTYAK